MDIGSGTRATDDAADAAQTMSSRSIPGANQLACESCGGTRA